MNPIHNLFARLGYQTTAYKVEQFKAEHPEHIVIDLHLNSGSGRRRGYLDEEWKKFFISKITGNNLFSALSMNKVYISVGNAEMDIEVSEYTVDLNRSRRNEFEYNFSLRYHVIFDAIHDGEYRFRYDGDKHILELVYERGDEHKIYTFTK